MPVVARVDPKNVFTPAEWSLLTSRSSLRGMWLVAHAWGTIIAAIAVVAIWPNPLTWLIAVMVVGARQLGLAILMHEAAHGGLHSNKAINEWVGQWLCAVPVGADLASYRSYHLQHHKFTQQPEDPDLSLSAPFPISKESYYRKAIRDLTGQTFVKQRLPLFLSLFRPKSAEVSVSHESFRLQRRRQDGALPLPECAAVWTILAGRRGHLVLGGLGVCDGDLVAAGDPDPQHRRTRLYLDGRRSVQSCSHHAR
jgi:fatty acid desaturase